MRNSESILSDLRLSMSKYIGKVFTEEMRQQIRLEATELMNIATSEGQAMFAPFVCANQGEICCPQDDTEIEEYDYRVCRKCFLNGGFGR